MPVPKVSPVTLEKVDCNQRLFARKTLDNTDLNQVVASSGFSENKGSGGVLSLAGLSNPVSVILI